MKKLFLFLFVGLFVSSVSANSSTEVTSMKCLINGVSVIEMGIYKSDTSTWSMPVAYEGGCRGTMMVSQKEKGTLYRTIYNYLKAKNYLSEEEKTDFFGNITVHEVLNSEGQTFVNQIYFPTLKEHILAEWRKSTPNKKRIAFYQYLADIIGYDYKVEQPG